MKTQTKLSPHYTERFGERICSKTHREQLFTDRAFHFGKTSSEVSDKRLSRYLNEKCHDQGYIIKAYGGRVYIFSTEGIAITVFLLPNKLRSLI